MTLTAHSGKRSSQRGISANEIIEIAELGTRRRRDDGVDEFVITTKVANEIIADLKRQIQKIERLKNKGIIADGDAIITVLHSYEKWRSK